MRQEQLQPCLPKDHSLHSLLPSNIPSTMPCLYQWTPVWKQTQAYTSRQMKRMC